MLPVADHYLLLLAFPLMSNQAWGPKAQEQLYETNRKTLVSMRPKTLNGFMAVFS